MTKSIDFYFDFISPYSYLAYKKIVKLEDLNISYKPILLGGLHKLGGITAPAFNERKMKNMKNDCELVAKKNDIQFKWNTKFPINSLSLMRGYLIVETKVKAKYFKNCFEAYWKNNLDISVEKNIKEILKISEINEINFFEKISQKKVKDDLKRFTDIAFEKNIFGAPTFVVNDKIFWGQDRLEYALDEYNSYI